MIFSRTTPAVLATLVIGFTLGGTALACSTDGWDAESGMVAVGQPFGAVGPDINGVARFEEFCGLVATDTGHVQTNSPEHQRVRARLYVWPNLALDVRGASVAADVIVLFSDEGGASPLAAISWNDGFWELDATANGGGFASTPATPGWTPLEMDWDPATSMVHLWVGTDATTELATISVASGPAATAQSARVGLPNGLGSHTGEVYVDSVEMHNETGVGLLNHCDANGDADVNVNDAVAVIDEVFQVALAPGMPDCDLSGGTINVNDAVAVIDVIFGG